jgi:hypothetical protein
MKELFQLLLSQPVVPFSSEYLENLETINTELEYLDFMVKRSYDHNDGLEYLVLVPLLIQINCNSDAALATAYSPDEISYFKKLVYQANIDSQDNPLYFI